MQKPLALSIAVCLGLTSCQLVEKSPTWETVMGVRPGDSFRQPDPSSSYADKLHRVLLEHGVEHMVVTYQYHYHTHRSEEALATRTAVVYRDAAGARYPWWLKDDRTPTPFWLPNGDLDKQLSFYARRPVQVIEKKVYPGRGGSSKDVLARFRPAQVQSRDHVAAHPKPVLKFAQTKPVLPPPAKSPPAPKIVQTKPVPAPLPPAKPKPVTKIAQTKPAPVPAPLPKPVATIYHPPAVAPAPPAKPVATAYHPPAEKPIAPKPTASPVAMTRVQRPPTTAVSKPKPPAEPAPGATIFTHFNPFWTPPAPSTPTAASTPLDPVAEAPEPSAHEEHFEKLFRARNGTSFDPTSAIDRRKMEQLKRGPTGNEISGESGIRSGVDGLELRQ